MEASINRLHEKLEVHFEDETKESSEEERTELVPPEQEEFDDGVLKHFFEEPLNKEDILKDARFNGIYNPTTYPIKPKPPALNPWTECFYVCIIVIGVICIFALVCLFAIFTIGWYQNYVIGGYSLNGTESDFHSEDENYGGAVRCRSGNGRSGILVGDPRVLADLSETVIRRSRQAKFQDCNKIRSTNLSLPSGHYSLRIKYGVSTLKTRIKCDMNTFGGGWTVIQSRGDFANPAAFFNRTWSSYIRGFGDEKGEIWLGLDLIKKISDIQEQELLIQLWDRNGRTAMARYGHFGLSSDGLYRPIFDRFSGNISDNMAYSNWEPFSTFDNDHSRSLNRSCPLEMSGGWWFRDCAPANLNAMNYDPSSNQTIQDKTLFWSGFTHIIRTEMKLRPQKSVLRRLEVPRRLINWRTGDQPDEVVLNAGLSSVEEEEEYEDTEH